MQKPGMLRLGVQINRFFEGYLIEQKSVKNSKKIHLQTISMTTLLTHTVAHSTRHSFRPKTVGNNQLIKKFLSLAIS